MKMRRFLFLLISTISVSACVNDAPGGQFLSRCKQNITTTTTVPTTVNPIPPCEMCICSVSAIDEIDNDPELTQSISEPQCFCECQWSRGVIVVPTPSDFPITTPAASDEWAFFNTETTTTTTTASTAAATTYYVPFDDKPAYNIGALDPRISCLYWGASMEGGTDPFAVTPGAYDMLLGEFGPASVVSVFISLPITNDWIRFFAPQLNAQSDLMITIEPKAGLQDAVNNAASTASMICGWASLLPESSHLLIRFAHEMNGNWYIWGQQPVEYVNAYRMLVNAVRSQPGCKVVRFVWSPNIGTGYPFSSATDRALPSALDTNSDGVVSPTDDAYDPFFPGDSVVDVVALSLYWQGDDTPPAGHFASSLNHQNFYQRFVIQMGKPLMIAETSAKSMQPGVKEAWLQQVLDIDTLDVFRSLRFIVWFEVKKDEGDFRIAVPDNGLVLQNALQRVKSCLCTGSFWV